MVVSACVYGLLALPLGIGLVALRSVRTILSPQGDLSCCYTCVFLIKDRRGRHYGRRFS